MFPIITWQLAAPGDPCWSDACDCITIKHSPKADSSMASVGSLTAVQYGIGPIGSRIVESTHDCGFEFVGAIDIDPDKIGEDLGDVAGLGQDLGVTVTGDPADALAAEPDVVFHSTVSSLADAKPQLEHALKAGANVVSTSEELAYPWWSNPDIASALTEIAEANDVTCLGAGINPGFAMDAMPTVLSTPMDSIESVRVERIQNAADRREPLQEKVGAGLDVETFNEEIVEGAGHVGSPESVAMLADALGWEITDIEETIEPVVAEEAVQSDYISVAAGEVAGIRQIARGFRGQEELVTLDLQMYLGADNPRDTVTFDGTPPVSISVRGGYHGDVSTTAVVRNVAPRVVDADPGLLSMIDLPLPRYRNCEAVET